MFLLRSIECAHSCAEEFPAIGKTGHRPKAARQHGFTLLEIIVVVIILSVITAAIVPMFGSSLSFVKLRSARNDFTALLLFVQERAVSESRELRISIDNKNGEYWVERFTGMDVKHKNKQFEPMTEAWAVKRAFPRYLKLDRFSGPKGHGRNRNAKFITCYPNGSSDRVKMTFMDTRNRSRAFTISTSGVMGQIEVKTGRQRVVE